MLNSNDAQVNIGGFTCRATRERRSGCQGYPFAGESSCRLSISSDDVINFAPIPCELDKGFYLSMEFSATWEWS